MKPSKLRLKRRAEQKRREAMAAALETAAAELMHVVWNPASYTSPIDVQRAKRARLYDAAINFVSAVDGEEQTSDKVVPIKKVAP